MKEITVDALFEYRKGKGTQCPFCSDEDLVGSSLDIDGDLAVQEIHCMGCDAVREDLYRLHTVRVVSGPDSPI